METFKISHGNLRLALISIHRHLQQPSWSKCRKSTSTSYLEGRKSKNIKKSSPGMAKTFSAWFITYSDPGFLLQTFAAAVFDRWRKKIKTFRIQKKRTWLLRKQTWMIQLNICRYYLSKGTLAYQNFNRGWLNKLILTILFKMFFLQKNCLLVIQSGFDRCRKKED